MAFDKVINFSLKEELHMHINGRNSLTVVQPTEKHGIEVDDVAQFCFQRFENFPCATQKAGLRSLILPTITNQ
jgi:hypothetical protein